jgi:5-methylcytosine-specific restriction endonuclease McrA
MFDSLRSRSHREILSNADRLVAHERKITLQLLEHLCEIERERYYLELGYGSIFQYCTAHLRYSEPAALRRMRAARCLAVAPQLYPLLESGDINTTTLAMVAKYLSAKNADEIIAAIRGKSKRAVEGYVAGLEPAAALPPDRVRAIVVPVLTSISERQTTVAGDGKKSSTVEEVTPTDCAGVLEAASPSPLVERQVLQLKRMARVEFTAHEELMEKLDRVRSLISHVLSANASLEQLIDFMADFVIERKDPVKRHERRRARAANQGEAAAATAPTNPRQIPAAVRDEIFARDRRCTYVGPDGKRCDSTHVLQIDHIKPVARGGAAIIDNLRLLCAYHNRLESERLMGKRGPSATPPKSDAPRRTGSRG